MLPSRVASLGCVNDARKTWSITKLRLSRVFWRRWWLEMLLTHKLIIN